MPVWHVQLQKQGKYPALEKAGFLIPVKVSVNEEGKTQAHGTSAFVPVGTQPPKCASAFQKFELHRGLAQKSPFFTKAFGERQDRIAKKMEEAGIATERPLLDTKDGRALFEKSGYSLDSPEGTAIFRNYFWSCVESLEKTTAKMHSLGITHNHLHTGNITIDLKGKLRIIDLGRARMLDLGKLKHPAKDWALRKFFPDLGNVSGLIFGLSAGAYCPRDHVFRNIVSYYSAELKDKMGFDARYALMMGYEKSKAAFRRLMEEKKSTG